MSARVASRPAPKPRGFAFAALRHADFRLYVTGATSSMMADNVEHVITYWVLWEKFQSPMLAGFAVVSHWLPYLFLSVYFGAVADRYDCRRVIQASQGLFMAVQVSWAVLFFTGSLQMWHAMVLLTLHGLAGAMWSPAEQLMLHDIVGTEQLESAVRLNATGRQLGIVFGPGVGGLLLLLLPPWAGILVNALIFLPLSLGLLRIQSSGHKHGASARKITISDAWQALAEASSNRAILAMIAVSGMSAMLIGSFMPSMPEFARDLSGSDAGLTYSALLASTAIGAVLGGLALETTGLARASVPAATGFAGLWGLSVAAFAITHSYAGALAFLFVSGVTQLAFNSMAQTVVQLQAPPHLRGRLVGAYLMTSLGLKAGSGLSIGVVGAALGLHQALFIAGLLTVLFALGMFFVGNTGPRLAPAYADAAELLPTERPCC
ncbi:MAG: MFS transporter [Chloroflexi bacterium]|nr:MFS transporter [Chloroflexota bacterium]